MSKIFEKAILIRLNKYLKKHNIIPPNQFGFRNNHSTTHQLLRLTDYIATNFQKSNHTLAIFLDIEKAFDRVWHDGLLYKIRKMGLPHYIQQIIKSFITNRRFKVIINAEQSGTYNISAGVPQGSPLSPTLFNIYISDIPSLTYSQIALFADDTALYTAHKDLLIGRDRLQEDLDTLTDWLNHWRIQINPDKCQSKMFSLRRLRTIPPLQIDNSKIPWETKKAVKYLGLQLDTKLTWKEHVTS